MYKIRNRFDSFVEYMKIKASPDIEYETLFCSPSTNLSPPLM